MAMSTVTRRWRVLAGLAAMLGIGQGAAAPAEPGQVPWHHAGSPYRAVFAVESAPTQPRGGTAVSVPTCGIGAPEGADFFATDERGVALALLPLGSSVRNEALALVAVGPDTRTVFVYFGSGTRAPVNRVVFSPSLTVDIRSLPDGPFENWADVQTLLAQSRRRARCLVDTIELSHNPVDSADGFIMVFEGFLDVSRAGPQTFMLVSDDCGYLFVDDQLAVARDGRRWARDAVRGESRATVELTAGLHAVRCVVVDAGGDQMALVGRWIDEKRKHTLRREDFLQPGRTRLLGMQARERAAGMPLFWYRLLSTMSVEDVALTEVEFGLHGEGEAQWEFGDGARRRAATFRRVFVGLQTVPVTVTQGRVRASGTVAFPENPPPQLSPQNRADFARYTGLLRELTAETLAESVLHGAIGFLKFVEHSPEVVPFCEALLARPTVDGEARRRVLLDLARGAAATAPDKATAAYQELFRTDASVSGWEALARECAEFALFARRDFDLAYSLIERMRTRLPPNDTMLNGLLFDLALQRGDVEGARPILDRLSASAAPAQRQRYVAVKSTALRERFGILLQNDFVNDARTTLWEWTDLAPHSRRDGSLSLARARLWARLGWLDGALGELDGAILLNPLLPNLPDVELERALVHRRAGNDAKARELLQRVAGEYPNAPAAQQAQELLK